VSAHAPRGRASAAAAAGGPVSWGALREPRHALPAVAVLVGTLAPAFGFFITATVLPSVVVEIGGLALYAWASTAYAVASILGSAGSSVVVGRLGTRGTLIAGAAVLAAGTVACATAPSMLVLVAGRALQGLGGGTMSAAVHGLVREAFPPALWSRMLATISAAWGVAAMSGPAVGGVFAGLGLWRGAFWCMVPLAAAAAAATWWLLPGRAAPAESHAGVAIGRLALVTGAVGAIALALRLDARARTRLFPAGMLSPRHAAGQGFWMVFFVAMCTTPGGVYIALLLQAIHGVTPAVAGYFYAAQSLAWTTAALLSARLGATRARGALVVGPAMIASGFAGVWWTLASGPLPAILAAVILLGGGIGACWAHVGAIILGSAREGEGAQTASLIPTTQTFAASLGAALCGIVANTAGLSGGATPAIAAAAGERLFGVFLVAPLLALVIAARLATPRR